LYSAEGEFWSFASFEPLREPPSSRIARSQASWPTAADQLTDACGHNIHVVGFVSSKDLLAAIPTAPKAKGEGYFILKNSSDNATETPVIFTCPVSM
jgi:hypothetical protein